jgi:quercetin dioxygenase-like cupin family protein
MRLWHLNEIETPNGVRSPVVLDSEDSRAVLVRLDPGQEMGEHQVRERAWVVIVDGAAEIATGEETVAAPEGTLVEFDPSERHTVRSAKGCRLLIFLAPWPGPGHYPQPGS